MLYEKNTKTYNFKDFALSYLGSARTCAQSFIDYMEAPMWEREAGVAAYAHMAFIPAIWNFKHALECGVKFLKYREAEEDLKRHHNLLNLVNGLKITDAELKNMSDKWCKLSPLKELTDYKGNNLFNQINDSDNQIFHYPEAKSGNFHTGLENFDYSNFLHDDNEKIMIKIMRELQKDVEETARIIGSLMSKLPLIK